MRIITATKAKKQLMGLINDVNKSNGKFLITKNGNKAVLISKDEYESLKETIEIMSDPKLVKEIEEGLKEIKKGNVVDYKEVFKQVKIKEYEKKTENICLY